MTVTVTGLTAERMMEMEDATIISGHIEGDNLILVTKGGDEIDAGDVRGIQGISGSGFIICTSGTRPSGPDEGTAIYETDTKLTRMWNGTRWRVQEAIVCTSSTRPTGLGSSDEGVQIYETDTNNKFRWSGSAWVSPEPRGIKAWRERVGDSPDITGAATVVDGYTTNFTAEDNRLYEVVLTPRIVGSADGDQCTVRMRLNGSNRGGALSVTCETAGRAYGGTMVWLLDGLSAGSKEISITIQKNNGTAVHTADAGQISIRDIGAS